MIDKATATQQLPAARPEWKEVLDAKPGHIFVDKFDEGVRFIIMRGPASLCAYVGVPEEHPLAGFDYESLPVDCHGGLTFASKGTNDWPKGFFWYGWDYAHSGDRSTYDDDPTRTLVRPDRSEKRWTVKEVEQDSWHATYEFRKLMKLAESIAAKAKAAEGGAR
jgi:hypothetical protein